MSGLIPDLRTAMALLCKDVSHLLGANQESGLYTLPEPGHGCGGR